MSEVVILCHLARQEVWTPVLDQLEAQHDVSFVDVPGFGDSPVPVAGASIPAMAAALARQIAPDAHVMGLSMAGTVALELARLGGVSGVTAISPPGYWSRLEAGLVTAEVASMWTAVRFASPLVERAGRVPLLRRQVWRNLVARPDEVPTSVGDAVVMGIARNMRQLTAQPDTLATFARSLLAYEPPSGGFPVPVTVLWGDQDRFTRFAGQARRAQHELPAARHVTLTGCGHIPFYDDPDQVARALLESCT